MSMSVSLINRFVGAIDQGTSSTKFVVYNHNGHAIGQHQLEHTQIYPQPGWVEHDPMEIWANTQTCVRKALEAAGVDKVKLEAVGITNQRESTLVWNKATGMPYYNVIVWNDARTRDLCEDLKRAGRRGIDRFRDKTGLPIATYFSATKILWLLENVPGLREDAEKGEAIFGTLDSWLIYKLTDGQTHITDVTNASRTLLMNLATLAWDNAILKTLGIPKGMLPTIKSSSEVYAKASTGGLEGVRLAGIMGDQQSALFGQTCYQAGQAKATYGTGAFLLMNTGNIVVPSTRGLLTTVAFKLGNHAPVYALEGSVAYCGSLIQWLRDNLGLLATTAESEAVASQVNDNGGLFFVPAFSGLFAPYWRDDARGVIVGMTAFNNKHHLVRAALESAAFQILEVLEAMEKDSGVQLQMLKVDGGMTENKLLMQFQADLLDVSVLTPQTKETTALGAAFAAGLAVGFWKNFEELRCIWSVGKKWDPYMPTKTRENLILHWKKAVQRSLGWVDKSMEEDAAGLGGVPLKLMRYASFSTSGPTGMVGDEGGRYSATRAWGALLIGTLGTLGVGLVLGSKWRR